MKKRATCPSTPCIMGSLGVLIIVVDQSPLGHRALCGSGGRLALVLSRFGVGWGSGSDPLRDGSCWLICRVQPKIEGYSWQQVHSEAGEQQRCTPWALLAHLQEIGRNCVRD